MSYQNPWTYQGQPFTENMIEPHIGFVYIITEIDTGKQYIGKKNFFRKVTKPPLKGKSRKRHSKASSDWMNYYGSSEKLTEQISVKGTGNYKREMIHLCKSKGEMSLLEAKEIIMREALRSNEFYNQSLICRIHSKHIL